jgi:hypothetical protein
MLIRIRTTKSSKYEFMQFRILIQLYRSHLLKVLDPHRDPDPQLFTSMRIQILKAESIRIHADPGPYPGFVTSLKEKILHLQCPSFLSSEKYL